MIRARYLGQVEEIDSALAAFLGIRHGDDLTPAQWTAIRKAAGDNRRAEMGERRAYAEAPDVRSWRLIAVYLYCTAAALAGGLAWWVWG